ncbi:hypothetical protein U1Q18_038511 [Sarracenia purpurea var. burkii]
MTVVKQPVKDSQDKNNSSSRDLQKSFFSAEMVCNEEINDGGKKFFEGDQIDRISLLLKSKVMPAAESETDQESIGSSEEMEYSPRSVAKLGRWTPKIMCVHSQVLRIREEDSHLGEGIGEGLSAKDKLCGHHHHVASSHMDAMLFVKPILPSSPLSGKAVH